MQTEAGLLVTAAIRDVTERSAPRTSFRNCSGGPDAIVHRQPLRQHSHRQRSDGVALGYTREELLGQPWRC